MRLQFNLTCVFRFINLKHLSDIWTEINTPKIHNNDQFGSLMQQINKLNLEEILQMPNVTKFLFSRTRIINEKETDKQKESDQPNDNPLEILPPKLSDPGAFSIPCSIGKVKIPTALCDLGASVSLMSKSVFDQLDSCKLEPTNVRLYFAEGSSRVPLGVVKNVTLQIGKLKIPADFVVSETDKTAPSSVILGRAIWQQQVQT